jgi:hypothetical protein
MNNVWMSLRKGKIAINTIVLMLYPNVQYVVFSVELLYSLKDIGNLSSEKKYIPWKTLCLLICLYVEMNAEKLTKQGANSHRIGDRLVWVIT